MITYSDVLAVGNEESARINLARSIITEHLGSAIYQMAMLANDYDRRRNRTILQYRKLLNTLSGEVVPDNFSANYKLCSGFFGRFITQENQYLLGNGVKWGDDKTVDKLGKDFDYQLQTAGRKALVGGVSFGFWNLDHMDVFGIDEFAPVYDDENGALMAGVRFWQIDADKPLRGTFYEVDGYTDYLWKDGQGEILAPKRPYKIKMKVSGIDGTEIYDGENYPAFPIVPLWANQYKQSEFVGMRENIDAYDLIKSGFANQIDDASQIYWIVQNAAGMDEIDLAKFLDQLRRVRAAAVEDDNSKVEPVTVDVPYNAREAILDRLRADMYEDFMALDTKNLASGAVTATQIKAAYAPLNNKTDMFEYCVLDFLDNILFLAGIDDNASFERSAILNIQEEVQTTLQAADYLSEDYITQRILTIFGDIDQLDDVLKARDEMDMARLQNSPFFGDDNAESEEEEDSEESGTGDDEEEEEETADRRKKDTENGDDVEEEEEEEEEGKKRKNKKR